MPAFGVAKIRKRNESRKLTVNGQRPTENGERLTPKKVNH
jgi:hypothetical protein